MAPCSTIQTSREPSIIPSISCFIVQKTEPFSTKTKFLFCQDVVQFGGFQITLSGVTPSESKMKAISNFPISRTLTEARSWFELVKQVTWLHILDPAMLPFRDLVKRDSHFEWNQSFEDAFQHLKQVIVDLFRKSITTFEKDRVTCDNIALISPDLIHTARHINLQYKGFPKTCSLTPPKVCEFWEVRHHLSTNNSLVLLDRHPHFSTCKSIALPAFCSPKGGWHEGIPFSKVRLARRPVPMNLY